MASFTEVEREILDAAEKAFADQGFHETVVKDIAERVGVGKGTVYRHFGKKKELFGSLIKHGTDQLMERIQSLREGDVRDFENLLDQLLKSHFDFFEAKRRLVEVIVKEGLNQTGDELRFVIKGWESYREAVRELLEEIPDSSPETFDPKVDTDLFLDWIWGVINSRAKFAEPGDGIELETYRRRMLEIFTKEFDVDE